MDKFTKNQSIGLIIGSIVLLTSIISIVVINNNIKNQINEALEDLENSNDSLEELNFSNLNFNFLSKSGAINDLEGELFFSFRAEDIIGDNDSRTYYKEDLETELKFYAKEINLTFDSIKFNNNKPIKINVSIDSLTINASNNVLNFLVRNELVPRNEVNYYTKGMNLDQVIDFGNISFEYQGSKDLSDFSELIEFIEYDLTDIDPETLELDDLVDDFFDLFDKSFEHNTYFRASYKDVHYTSLKPFVEDIMNMMNIIVEEIGPSDDLFYLDRDFNNMLNKLVDIVSNVDEQIINVAIVPDSSFIEYSVENFLKNQYPNSSFLKISFKDDFSSDVQDLLFKNNFTFIGNNFSWKGPFDLGRQRIGTIETNIDFHISSKRGSIFSEYFNINDRSSKHNVDFLVNVHDYNIDRNAYLVNEEILQKLYSEFDFNESGQEIIRVAYLFNEALFEKDTKKLEYTNLSYNQKLSDNSPHTVNFSMENDDLYVEYSSQLNTGSFSIDFLIEEARNYRLIKSIDENVTSMSVYDNDRIEGSAKNISISGVH